VFQTKTNFLTKM